MATLAAEVELELNVRNTAMGFLRACQPCTMGELAYELEKQAQGVDRSNAMKWAYWFVIIGQQDGLIEVDGPAIDLTDKGWVFNCE